MITVIQGTTPSLVFKLPLDTATLSGIEMTIADYEGVKIKKTTATYSATYYATFALTQTETADLAPGEYTVQLRVKVNTGKIYATQGTTLKVAPLASRDQL